MSRDSKTMRRTTPKRSAKRDALLAEAARQVNDRGAGAVALNDVADSVGLSRNALYYYVSDRIGLVFQCYEQACDIMAGDIAAAAEAEDAAASVKVLIDRVLASQRPDCAVASDVDFLDDQRRDIIRAKQTGNVAALSDILQRGVTEGTLRPHDSEVAAQSILGMLSWVLLSPRWMKRGDGKAARRMAASALKTIAVDGLVKPGHGPAPLALDVDTLTNSPINAFDREQASLMKTQQLVAAASRLFNRKGIDGTSLDEIGAEAGTTKGAIYHYFSDKTDLVVRCYDRALEIHDLLNKASRAAGDDAVTQIAAHLLLASQAQSGPLSPLSLQAGFLNLPDDVQTRIRARTARYRAEWDRRLRQGIAEGSCRAISSVYASAAHAGIFTWLPKWLPVGSQLDRKRLSAEIVDFALFGLRRRSNR